MTIESANQMNVRLGCRVVEITNWHDFAELVTWRYLVGLSNRLNSDRVSCLLNHLREHYAEEPNLSPLATLKLMNYFRSEGDLDG